MHNILQNIIANSDFSVEVYESDIDHYHFLIRYIPRLSISQIVRTLKQQSTYHIWQLHQYHFVENIGAKICFEVLVTSFVQ